MYICLSFYASVNKFDFQNRPCPGVLTWYFLYSWNVLGSVHSISIQSSDQNLIPKSKVTMQWLFPPAQWQMAVYYGKNASRVPPSVLSTCSAITSIWPVSTLTTTIHMFASGTLVVGLRSICSWERWVRPPKTYTNGSVFRIESYSSCQ